MLPLAALLLASAPVAETEKAFDAAATRDGQWTAFRTYAAEDAIMFAPDKVPAMRFLAGRADPAVPVQWRPTHTITACDGSLALSTGPWTKGAAHGSYETIWRADPGGWAWIYDGGHDAPADASTPSMIEEQASCDGAPAVAKAPQDPVDGSPLAIDPASATIFASDGPPPATLRLGAVLASGNSVDRSLLWRINALPDGDKGAHLLRLWSWDGHGYGIALLDLSGSFTQSSAVR